MGWPTHLGAALATVVALAFGVVLLGFQGGTQRNCHLSALFSPEECRLGTGKSGLSVLVHECVPLMVF
jgi:hypothetical protein